MVTLIEYHSLNIFTWTLMKKCLYCFMSLNSIWRTNDLVSDDAWRTLDPSRA